MTIYAYCRVSTVEQNESAQVEAIKAKYPECKVFTEKASATSRDHRHQLDEIIRHLSKGDKLVVWKLDRLARNMADLSNLVREIESAGAALEILDQAIDTSTASGKAFLQMLGVFAEFETNLRAERQKAGVEIAKAQGKYKYENRSARRSPITSKIKKRLAEGRTPKQIADELGCTVQTVYNVRSKVKAMRQGDEQQNLIA